MENSQLADALRSLGKKEFKEFGKFIESPYFNNRNEVVRFYNSIKKFYPDFKSKLFDSEKIFGKVYPGKKYSDVLMRKLISLTINLMMDFLAVEGYKESELEYNVKLIDKLRIKKLPALFDKKIKNVNELLRNSKHSFGYYESKYKYTTFLNWHDLEANEKSIGKLQNEIDDFMEYFLCVSLLLYIRLGEWSRNFSMKFDLKFYNEVINYFSERGTDTVSLPVIYFYMMMLLDTEEEEYFFSLQKSRDEFEEKLSNMDDYNISIVLIQYCYKRVVKGAAEFRRHQHDITNTILKKNLIPEGFMEPYFFTNAIRNAYHIKELEWSEQFIIDYKHMLKPDIAEEIVDYSHAMIEFGRKNYEKSLKYLSKINLERSNMKLDVKNLLIIIYYELNYTEELISLIDTYKHFLHRDTNMSEQSKNANTLFVNLVSDLLKIKLSEKNDSALNLMMKIEKSPYSNFKDWLLEKTHQLSSPQKL